MLNNVPFQQPHESFLLTFEILQSCVSKQAILLLQSVTDLFPSQSAFENVTRISLK